MWFAVGIIGVIAIAVGISLAPHPAPTQTSTPPASSAPATPGGQDSGQH